MRRDRPVTQLVAAAPDRNGRIWPLPLAQLSQPYREVVVLHYLADIAVDDVAQLLDVPVGTVKSGCRGPVRRWPRASRATRTRYPLPDLDFEQTRLDLREPDRGAGVRRGPVAGPVLATAAVDRHRRCGARLPVGPRTGHTAESRSRSARSPLR